jgi:hypothetical protein
MKIVDHLQKHPALSHLPVAGIIVFAYFIYRLI